MLVCSSSLLGSDLVVVPRQGSGESGTAHTISVQDAPETVKAFAMDIRYDKSAMNYVSFKRGPLGADGYPMFNVNEYKPGVLRIGGIDPLEQGIVQGDSGEFLYLNFEVKGQGGGIENQGALTGDQDLVRLLIVTLLVVVLVLVAVFLVILAAIFVMLVLIYWRLKALDESGRIIFKTPIMSWTAQENTGRQPNSDSYYE